MKSDEIVIFEYLELCLVKWARNLYFRISLSVAIAVRTQFGDLVCTLFFNQLIYIPQLTCAVYLPMPGAGMDEGGIEGDLNFYYRELTEREGSEQNLSSVR